MTILCLFACLLFQSPSYAEAVPPDKEWVLTAHQAQVLLKQHRLPAAAELSKRALRIAKPPGPAHEHLGITYFQLGNIYREWGHCAEARADFSLAIETWKKQPHPPGKFIFNAMVSLLGLMCECEEFQAAAKKYALYKPELQRYRSDVHDDAELLAVAGVIARATGRYAQAEALYRQEIQLLEQTPGNNATGIEEERVNLAMVIGKQGRHAESLAESEHVIAYIDRNQLNLPVTLAGALNNAACELAELGRKEDAQRVFERAISVAVEGLGEDNRFTARLMLNYARILRENKQTPAAAAMQKKGEAAYHRAILRDSATIDLHDLRQ